MIEIIYGLRSKYFLLFLALSVLFISTNSEASSFYWRNGTDVGSSFYLRNGTDVGSSFYWRNGTDSSFWGNQMIFVCMGLIDDNKDDLPEICESYE